MNIADYQRQVSEFVSREVHYCASELTSQLVKADLSNTDYDAEDLWTVLVQDDWLEPATDYVPDLSRDDCIDALESIGIDCRTDDTIETLRDAVEANLNDSTMDAQEFCESFNLDPYQREAYEHWIVSDWLADKLEERGEMVLRDFMGLTI